MVIVLRKSVKANWGRAACLFLICAASQLPSQQMGLPQTQSPSRIPGLPSSGRQDDVMEDASRASMEARRQKAMAEDRRKHMVMDAERLVKLANEIKAQSEASGKDELSTESLKKVAEMEKLARDLRSRMTN